MMKKLVEEKGFSLSTAMNARLIGSGTEPMVLCHGYGGDQSVWDKVLPYLTQRYLILLFDWNFSGSINHDNQEPNNITFDAVKYSSYEAFADDLIDLLDEMDLKSTVLIGHSMSGMIGCIASIKRPDLFSNLILVGASPRYINIEGYEGGFEKPAIDQILSSIESNFHGWASNFSSLVGDPKDLQSVQKFKKCLQRMRPEIALAVAKIIFLSDERDMLEKVTTPCTIIQTKSDFVVPNSVPDYMNKKIKGKSTTEIVDAHGHFPHMTAPDQFLEVLGRVLGF
ncbi:hypothetical protein LguiB_011667 [Lonicera macranthoides]